MNEGMNERWKEGRRKGLEGRKECLNEQK